VAVVPHLADLIEGSRPQERTRSRWMRSSQADRRTRIATGVDSPLVAHATTGSMFVSATGKLTGKSSTLRAAPATNGQAMRGVSNTAGPFRPTQPRPQIDLKNRCPQGRGGSNPPLGTRLNPIENRLRHRNTDLADPWPRTTASKRVPTRTASDPRPARRGRLPTGRRRRSVRRHLAMAYVREPGGNHRGLGPANRLTPRSAEPHTASAIIADEGRR
jgi:hypothetical protein